MAALTAHHICFSRVQLPSRPRRHHSPHVQKVLLSFQQQTPVVLAQRQSRRRQRRALYCAAEDRSNDAVTPPVEDAVRVLPEFPPRTPGLAEANAVFCLGIIWLVFLTDLSGIGPLLLASDNVSLSLAVLQWTAFVAPVVAHSLSSRFDTRATFALRGCDAGHVAGAALGGASLWILLAAATALRGGVDPQGAETSYRIVEATTTVFASPSDGSGWASLLALGALAPAAAEELLFRGYLLTALRSKLGSIDALCVCAMLFACFHMSVSQFAPVAVLGIATGWATVATGSVAPAIVLHACHNAAALVWGAAMTDGIVAPGPPDGGVVVAGLLGAGLGASLLRGPGKLDTSQ